MEQINKKKEIAEMTNKEIRDKCRPTQMKKLREMKEENGSLNKYFTQLTREEARTIFEVGTNMMRTDSNYGKQKMFAAYVGKRNNKTLA